ncbi:MAG: hypothetical protein Q4F55_05595 [Bacillota bacterium]|nr:hypothetical protein [Bacillota bacterium]
MNGKKVAGILIIAAITLMLIAGCSKMDSEDSGEDDTLLIDLANNLCDGVDVPEYEAIALDKSNFEYFAFIPYEQGIEAVAADALVNIEAHSLVVIRTESDNASSLAQTVFEKANPNKWLCVGAEKVNVAYTNHYIVLVMSREDIADDIISNFKTQSHKLYDGEVNVLSAVNNIREFE